MDQTYTLNGRDYILHLPVNYDPSNSYPLVVGLHGGGGHATNLIRMSLLESACDAAGYVAVFPNGSGTLTLYTWNAGLCCGYAVNHNVDDVTFFRNLLADLASHVNYDPKRVYATGHSNGAMMCYRLACEASDVLTAIAPVSGGLGVQGPQPSRTVPILHFHGMQDEHYPFNGGVGGYSLAGVDFLSIPDTLGRFAAWYGCGQQVDTTTEAGVTRRDWPGVGDTTPLSLYIIDAMGHQWPGGKPQPAWLNAGPYAGTPVAQQVMLDWFQQWSL